MFQYYAERIFSMMCIEDTDLITESEAKELWNKYYDDVVCDIKNERKPQMCIWKDCEYRTNYHSVLCEIDWRDDLEISNGVIFKKEKSRIGKFKQE
jgi:hypothetical protein